MRRVLFILSLLFALRGVDLGFRGFVENRGQLPQEVLFYGRFSGYWAFVGKGFIEVKGNHGVRIALEGVSRKTAVKTAEMKAGVLNFIKGRDPEEWVLGVRRYGRVIFKEIYPATDLILKERDGNVEMVWKLRPGADPSSIRIRFPGAELRRDGSLGRGSVVLKKLNAWQGKREVVAEYVCLGKDLWGIRVKDYDRRKELIIDPVVWSTFLGGSDVDVTYGAAVDSSFSLYLTGETYSSNFPLSDPYDSSYHGEGDVFVAKFAPDGQTLIYSTFIGGSEEEEGYSIAVTSGGEAVVVGSTESDDFPLLNPIQNYRAGHKDGFVLKLSPDGSSLLLSTYFGGSGDDEIYDVALGASGEIVLTGYTRSNDFPVQNPYQGARDGRQDAFLAKLSPDGQTLVFSTYLGGRFNDIGYSAEVGGSGEIYFGGRTSSSDFPVTSSSFQPTYRGGGDGFVARFNADGSVLEFSSFLGGSKRDQVRSVEYFDGTIYITGRTRSSDFPLSTVPPPFQSSLLGTRDAFITVIDSTGSSMEYSTYFGGTGRDNGENIIIDNKGRIFLSGYTTSSDFPLENPDQSNRAGSFDVFASVFTYDPAAGLTLLYSSYWGGSNFDDSHWNASGLDPYGCFFKIGGHTVSQDFPTVSPYQGSYGGGLADVLAFSITLNEPPVVQTVSPPSPYCVGEEVSLEGSGTDPEGDPLEHHWELTARPSGSSASIQDPSSWATSIIPDLPGPYMAELVVRDVCGSEIREAVNFNAEICDEPPLANFQCSSPVSVGEKQCYEAQGTDPDGDPIVGYAWSLMVKPQGSRSEMNPKHEKRSCFVPDKPGIYLVRLKVASRRDGKLVWSSRAHHCVVKVEPSTTCSCPAVALQVKESSDRMWHRITEASAVLTWKISPPQPSCSPGGFRIYRNGVRIAQVGPGVRQYEDRGFPRGSFWRVVPYFQEIGECCACVQIKLHLSRDRMWHKGAEGVLLRWDVLRASENPCGVKGFRIYRDGVLVKELGKEAGEFFDPEGGAPPHTYKVIAVTYSGKECRVGEGEGKI